MASRTLAHKGAKPVTVVLVNRLCHWVMGVASCSIAATQPERQCKAARPRVVSYLLILKLLTLCLPADVDETAQVYEVLICNLLCVDFDSIALAR